jgi:hypothetical protein
MPRSFRYDHFLVPKRDVRPIPHSEDRAAYARTHQLETHETLHYGKAHARTEELLEERRQVRGTRYEELKAARERRARRQQGAVPRTGLPIGALPPTQEAPVPSLAERMLGGVTPPEGFQGLLDEAQRNVKVLQQALSDVTGAIGRLARLPRDAARLTAQRLRPA